MKRKKIILFFISFFLFSAFTSVVGTSNIDYWDKVTIMDDNFSVAISNTPNLHSYSGNRGLKDIIPVGIQDTDNESIKIFIAKAQYTFSVVFWTECGANDAVSLSERTATKKWLGLTTCTGTLQTKTTTNYYVKYNYYSVSPKTTGKGFSGNVLFDADLSDLTPSELDFGNTVVNINSKQFISELSSIMLIDSHVEEHAKYASIVNTNENAEIVVKDVSPNFGTAESKCDEASSIIASHFNNVNLGVRRGSRTTSTIQQGKTTIPRGSVDDIKTKGVYISLVPDIKKINQEIIIRSQDITVDTKTQLFSPAKILQMTSVKQETNVVPIGVDVKNYAISLDLQADFLLYSTCEIDQLKEEEKPTLEIPESELEDYYWDQFLEGQTEAYLAYQEMSDAEIAATEFWSKYGTVIIIAGVSLLALAGIAGFIYVKYFTPVGMVMSDMSKSNLNRG